MQLRKNNKNEENGKNEENNKEEKLILRPFQIEGVEFLTEAQRACLFDEMGLGKTPQTICSLRQLQSNNGLQTLVVCPSYAVGVWEAEIEKWWPEAKVFKIQGTAKRRQKAWDQYQDWKTGGAILNRPLPAFVLITYSLLGEVKEKIGFWPAIVYDECHKISSRGSLRFRYAQDLKSKYLFFLSGTPIRKSPDELWCYFNLIDPKANRSYWRWAGTHMHIATTVYGKEIVGPKSPSQFQEYLKPCIKRRLKKDVLTELPAKQRQPIWVHLPPKHIELYNELADEMMINAQDHPEMWTEGGLIIAQNSLSLSLRLRQFTVSPRLLDLSLLSPAITEGCELATDILESGENVVIFSVFRQALSLIAEHLPVQCPIYLVHGENDPDDNATNIRLFNDHQKHYDRPAVLMSTTSMAASWSATSASKAIFIGPSWSPIDNFQSEDRLHRYGQKHPVNIYYVLCKGTIDERVLEVLDGKVHLSRLAFDPHYQSKGKGRNKNGT